MEVSSCLRSSRPPVHACSFADPVKASARRSVHVRVSEPVVGAASATVDSTRTVERQKPLRLPATEEAGPAWTVQEYQKLFRNYWHEEDYEIDNVEGEIPLDIVGSFYRNGPGILELGGKKMHVFDGHGLIARVSLQNGRAVFKSRYVKTKVYEEEMKAKKVLYRGFGSMKPGGVMANFLDIRDKPVANTSIMEWAGKLYALWEAHNPFVLDPATLDTIGEEQFDGVLRPEQPFTAHPCYDPHTGRLVAFSNGIRHGEGKLHIWEIDQQNHIRKAITHKVGLLPVLYLHDFKVTKNWYVFNQAPLGLNTGNAFRYLAGFCEQTQQVFFDASLPGKWWLVPRDGGSPVIVETAPGMIWHYGNAYEDERTGEVSVLTGNVIVDACYMDTFSFSDFDMHLPSTVPVSEVARFEIDQQAGTSRKTTLLAHSADFPQINPAFQGSPSYKYLYVASSTDAAQPFPFRRITKLNVQSQQIDSWLAPKGCFVGEPIYVPRTAMPLEKELLVAAAAKGAARAGLPEDATIGPSIPLPQSAKPIEDDGYVVCLLSDARKERSSLVILDAQNLEEGPLCQLHLRKLMPMAFHCAWSSAVHM